MAKKDIEKIKQLIEKKKSAKIESSFLQPDKKIGSGKTEKMHKRSGHSRTKI